MTNLKKGTIQLVSLKLLLDLRKKIYKRKNGIATTSNNAYSLHKDEQK